MGQIGEEHEERTVIIPEPVAVPFIEPKKQPQTEPGVIPMEPIQVPVPVRVGEPATTAIPL